VFLLDIPRVSVHLLLASGLSRQTFVCFLGGPPSPRLFFPLGLFSRALWVAVHGKSPIAGADALSPFVCLFLAEGSPALFNS